MLANGQSLKTIGDSERVASRAFAKSIRKPKAGSKSFRRIQTTQQSCCAVISNLALEASHQRQQNSLVRSGGGPPGIDVSTLCAPSGGGLEGIVQSPV